MKRTNHNTTAKPAHPARPRRLGLAIRALNLIALALALCPGAYGQRTATAEASVFLGLVTGITVTDGGSGYTAPPAVTLVGGGGSGAVAVSLVSEGAVSAVLVVAPGFGFTSAPQVVIAPPPLQLMPAALSINLVPAPSLTVTGASTVLIPQLTISVQSSLMQEVQYTDSLSATSQWSTLTVLGPSDHPNVVVDVGAFQAGVRFYRVVSSSTPGPDPARWAWIQPGSFLMGSPETEFDRSSDEGPQTQVTIRSGYWIGRFEVTQGEYTAVVGTNFSTFAGDTNQPVEQVSWFDATNYCGLLTAQERAAGRLPDGYEYRLPTEAEWEFATRAGTTNRFFFGDDHDYSQLPNYAWFNGNSGQSTHDVGGKQQNPWGLYDTSGNVFEWCADWYGPYPGGSTTDPAGPASGTGRVMRGGSWRYPGGDARSAARNFNLPEFASYGIGIRVVLGRRSP